MHELLVQCLQNIFTIKQNCKYLKTFIKNRLIIYYKTVLSNFLKVLLLKLAKTNHNMFNLHVAQNENASASKAAKHAFSLTKYKRQREFNEELYKQLF